MRTPAEKNLWKAIAQKSGCNRYFPLQSRAEVIVMLSAVPEVQALLKNKVQITDITRCLCLRAHHNNPWILDNLRLQFQHFSPGPPTVVVDQGSEPQWARQVEALTLAQGGRYFYDDYQGLYSPSRAHNLAAAQVKTDFIFFTDPDSLAVHDLFPRLLELINRAGLGAQLDLMINLPVVHLNEAATEIFRQAAT